jgi:hypothetical protein
MCRGGTVSSVSGVRARATVGVGVAVAIVVREGIAVVDRRSRIVGAVGRHGEKISRGWGGASKERVEYE